MGGENQENGKFIDFTKDEIKEYLSEMKGLILNDHYIISAREINDTFGYEYRINTAKEKEILLNIQYSDFCYAASNYKPEYAHEKLYIFCIEYELDHWGTPEVIKIYIKMNLTQTKMGKNFMIVISFHELINPIKYLFR